MHHNFPPVNILWLVIGGKTKRHALHLTNTAWKIRHGTAFRRVRLSAYFTLQIVELKKRGNHVYVYFYDLILILRNYEADVNKTLN